jgi:hypothetical protein
MAYTDIRVIPPLAGSVVATSPTEQVLYDGLTIPPDSLLYFYGGQHAGAPSTTLNDPGQSWQSDELVDLILRNTSLDTSGTITGNTTTTVDAGILFNDDNYYEVVADIAANDIISYQSVTNLGGSVVVTVKGVPSITGISGEHSFSWRVFDEALQEWTPLVVTTIAIA